MSYRPITDTWMLCRGKTGYYGCYPAGFLERARYLLGVTIFDPVLHICGGKVRDYQSGPMKSKGFGPNDRTVDLDPSLEPDFLLDVRTIGTSPGDVFPFWTPIGGDKADGVTVGTFDVTSNGEGPHADPLTRRPWCASLIDRPYTDDDADHYFPGQDYPKNLNDLLKRALAVTRIGGRVGVLDYYFPRPPREGVTLVACIGVTVGWGNRMRCFSVFERTAYNPLEYNVTTQDEPDEAEEDDETALELAEEAPEEPEEPETAEEPDSEPEAPEEPETPPEPAPSKARKKVMRKKAKRKRASLTDGFGV